MLYFQLDKKENISQKAKESMIDIHGEKIIKAWLDKNEFQRRKLMLEGDMAGFSAEVRQAADDFVNKKRKGVAAKKMPEGKVAEAVNTIISLEAVENSLKTATKEYDFYNEVVEKIKQI
jgi:hypothetical protein